MPVDEFGREIPPINQSRDESPPPYRSSSRQRERGESPYFERRSRASISEHHHHHHHHHPSHNHHHSGGRSGSSHYDRRSPPRRRRSPSPRNQRSQRTKPMEAAAYRYADEPMLCEFVWKSQKEGEAEGREDKEQLQPPQDGEEDIDDNNSELNEPKTYEEYRRRYCLNYVRSFFNQHMDDSWFRARYSPLGRRRLALEERDRATREATVLREEMEASMHEKGESDDRCSFVRNARLAGGQKQNAAAPISRKRKHGDPAPSQPRQIPKSHVLSLAHKALAIQEIPPHVTDEQLCLALMDHCTKAVKGDGIRIYSSSVSVDNHKPLLRDAFCIFESEEIRLEVLNNMIKTYTDANSHRAAPAATDDGIHVPRKDDIRVPDTLELEVECSDPYGRADIDADGKGSAPADDKEVVPTRKSTVLVLTQTPLYQPVQVLSAAVSSRERIGRDKEAAIMLARALDVSRSIPKENRLDDLLEMLFPAEEMEQINNNSISNSTVPNLEEDMLDVSIAYLRRVHLFCFYNGCSFAQRVGDVLSGRHAAGTIHMRLHNADEILGNAREDAEVMYGDLSGNNNNSNNSDAASAKPAVDLLVKRLDDSIARALEESNQWVAQASYVVDDVIDEQAAEVEEAEERAKDEWVDDHCLADDDGRARCAFHFCKKLFRDDGFLRKHLLKKHVEFLRAAVAQAHDDYMMKAWDLEEHRPVPPIMVDCGAGFGLVPSPVIGVEPMAADPEPDLWQKEEERRKRMQAAGSDQQQVAQGGRHREMMMPRGGGMNTDEAPSRPAPRVNTFVDVDDMKEEKIEIKFDDIVVPDVQPPAKKKKKKKLL